jgi:sporadic carbohydrate cluster protein (TIGR04323 family)
MSEAAPAGYRGYIASRLVAGNRTPQHIQNLVIREHARRRGLAYLLSATEYAMDGCYLMLMQLIDELGQIEGIIAYSMFMLPQRRERRRVVYERLLERGGILHFAVEDMVIATPDDAGRVEEIIILQQLVQTPSDVAWPRSISSSP